MALDPLSKQLFLNAAPFLVAVDDPVFATWQRVYQELANDAVVQAQLSRLLNTAIRQSESPGQTMAMMQWIVADVNERLPRMENNVVVQVRNVFNALISSNLFKQTLIARGIDDPALQARLLQVTPQVSPATSWAKTLSQNSLYIDDSSDVSNSPAGASSAGSSSSGSSSPASEASTKRVALTDIATWTSEMVYGAVYDLLTADDGPMDQRKVELQWLIDNAMSKLTLTDQMRVVNGINSRIASWSSNQRERRYNIWKMWTNNNDLLRSRRLDVMAQEEEALNCIKCKNSLMGDAVECTGRNCKAVSHATCVTGDIKTWQCPTCSLQKPANAARPVNVLVARKKPTTAAATVATTTTAAAATSQAPPLRLPAPIIPTTPPARVPLASASSSTTTTTTPPPRVPSPRRSVNDVSPQLRGSPPPAPQLTSPTWKAEPILRALQLDRNFDVVNEEIRRLILRAPSYIHASPAIWNAMTKDAQVMTAISNSLDTIAGSTSVLEYLNHIKQQVQHMLNPKTTRPIRVPVAPTPLIDDDFIEPMVPLVRKRKVETADARIKACKPTLQNTVDVSQVEVPSIASNMRDRTVVSKPANLLTVKQKSQYQTLESDPLLAFTNQVAVDIPVLPLQIAPNDSDAARKSKLLHWTKCLRDATLTIDQYRQSVQDGQIVNELIHTLKILTDGVCRYVQTPKYDAGIGTYLEVMALQAERQITFIFKTYPTIPRHDNPLCGVVLAFA